MPDELRRLGHLELGQIVPVVAGWSDAALAFNVLQVATVEPDRQAQPPLTSE